MTLRAATVLLSALASLAGAKGDAPSVDQLLRLKGKELLQAAEDATYSFYAEDCPYSEEDYIAIAERLSSEDTSPHLFSAQAERLDNPIGTFLVQACKGANDQQVDRLVAIYRKLNPASFDRSHVLPFLTGKLVDREVREIVAENLRVQSPTALPAPPEKLQTMPPDLVEAWRQFARFRTLYDQAFPNEKQVVDAFLNRKSFTHLIDAALSGETRLEKQLQPYAATGANCLNMTEEEDAKDMATLLMLLRERRLDLAVGSSLRAVTADGSTSSPEGVALPVIRFLNAVGIDWETLFAGAEVEPVLAGWNSQAMLLEALSVYGSDKAALYLTELARLAGEKGQALFARALLGMLDKGAFAEEYNVPIPSSRLEGARPHPVSQTAQKKCLATIESFIGPDTPSDLADEALAAFARTRSLTSVPALQQLAHSRFARIAEISGAMLEAMGLPAPQSKPVNTSPVAWKILVNGTPLRSGSKVYYEALNDEGSLASDTEVRKDCTIRIESDRGSQTATPKTVRLSQSHLNGDPVFDVSSVPNGTPLQVVNVSAGPLEIALRNQDHLNAPFSGKVFLTVRPHKDGNAALFREYFSEKNKITADPTIKVPIVQFGTYDVCISHPGAEIWRGVVEVGPGVRPTQAFLKPGSDLRYSIPLLSSDFSILAGQLFRDGEALEVRPNPETNSYQNLPCGHYLLKISGSDTIEKTRQERNIARGPDEMSFAGREIPFTISEGSPSLIDLGSIELEAKKER